MVSEIVDWAGEDADEAQTENLNSTYPSDFRRRNGRGAGSSGRKTQRRQKSGQGPLDPWSANYGAIQVHKFIPYVEEHKE